MQITLALAEIKLISKRIEQKRDFIETYLSRSADRVDPLIKDGGAEEAIKREMQSIHDLEERLIVIRRAIAKANAENTLTVEGTTRSIADWLTWKREVAPQEQLLLQTMIKRIELWRAQTNSRGGVLVQPGTEGKSTDLVVNYSEQELANRSETLQKILGGLDGQLSLANATILI
jgi:hypothetical protein